MSRFAIDPEARGIDLPGARVAWADRRGHIVADGKKEQYIRLSYAATRYETVVELVPGRFESTPSDLACACGFTPWPWQSDCPRCGAHLVVSEA